MKHKHFYSHLIQSTDITLEIAELDIQKQERVNLLSLFEVNIHASVVSAVLDELSPEDKKIFLKHLSEGNHKKLWQHLNQKIKNANRKIENTIKRVKKELLEDIQEAKKLKKKSKSF
ncbi:MAG: hypothetical protein A3B38_03275 [Candidatus Levybacteria bacterium RIFCSPLOWO2_01_FULL_36_13]|nr:MAG: hypothetical protein A2684_04220 [Candidatus Levybacteria bacterium RIFCSPHIGHO2_01_FULL_36_15b]OGH34702.1 MAG: hypothetical protein A3B38_03275 [Candidatus Levybacteria bacterium RIFCSPLOWO2_01_FULL_36_13]